MLLFIRAELRENGENGENREKVEGVSRVTRGEFVVQLSDVVFVYCLTRRTRNQEKGECQLRHGVFVVSFYELLAVRGSWLPCVACV